MAERAQAVGAELAIAAQILGAFFIGSILPRSWPGTHGEAAAPLPYVARSREAAIRNAGMGRVPLKSQAAA
jgi:hypothetical protein